MNDALGSFVTALGWALVHFVWQGALLGLVTASVLVLLRNARPQLRYTFLCFALATCVALPMFDLVGYENSDGLTIFADEAADVAQGGVDRSAALDVVLAWVSANLTAIVAVWAGCAALFAVRLIFGLAWVARISSTDSSDHAVWQAKVIQLAQRMQVYRNISVRVVHGLNTPAVAGWWRPMVLVPSALIVGMPPDMLEALLAHEVAHIKRFDYLINFIQSTVEILLFYHPVVWWISGRIRIEREQIADDLAAGILGEPRRLALALHELEQFQFSSTHLALAASGGKLMSRIQRLIRPNVQPIGWKVGISAVSVLLAGIAFCAHAAVGESPSSVNETAAAAVVPIVSAHLANIETCKPKYPDESLKRQETGTVRLSILVDSKGRFVSSRLDKTSGYPALDDAAKLALGKCEFNPGMKDGKAVRSWLTIDYVWAI
jgi:bla regulator protein BlaR1